MSAKQHLIFILLLLALFGPTAAPAGAMEWEVPQGWRFITRTKSTSDCIGRPVTPLCAVETLRACFLRGDAYSLCIKATDITGPDARIDYHAETIRNVSEEELRRERNIMRPLIDGDVLVVLFDNGCPPGDIYCTPTPSLSRYYYQTRKHAENAWTVISYSSDFPEGTDDDQAPTRPSMTLIDSDSACIGNPITPLCAVETLMACLLRAKAELCASAGRPDIAPRPAVSRYAKLPGGLSWYGVEQIRDVSDAELRRIRQARAVMPRDDDIWVEIISDMCPAHDMDCLLGAEYRTWRFLTRRGMNDTWRVVTWQVTPTQ